MSIFTMRIGFIFQPSTLQTGSPSVLLHWVDEGQLLKFLWFPAGGAATDVVLVGDLVCRDMRLTFPLSHLNQLQPP